jgi:hypothetical protein
VSKLFGYEVLPVLPFTFVQFHFNNS